MATVTTDPSAVRIRDTMTCGGTRAATLAVGGAVRIEEAAGVAGAADVGGEAAGGTGGDELHAAAARQVSMPSACAMRVLRCTSLAVTRSRMPGDHERSMKRLVRSACT